MKDIFLIGIDGGATKISGWQILINDKTGTFSSSDNNIAREYRDYPGFNPDFKPLDLQIQLAEMHQDIKLTDDEIAQSDAYMTACADVITDFFKISGGRKLLVGIGMPGLKTQDKRGIAALANGPRMPYFAREVENKLKNKGVELFSPVAMLGSDADYCGVGEEFAENGQFRSSVNAYYLGGGTGIADAIKLNGKLIAFDQIKDWIAKTWEMKTDIGLSLERFTSASGIQYIYSKNSGIPVEKLNEKGIFPPHILKYAIDKNLFAIISLNEVSHNLAKLIFERITTIYFGWQDHFGFINPNRTPLESNHEYKGILLDKIIIGQRLGDLVQESIGTGILFEKIIHVLTELTIEIEDVNFKKHYLSESKFNKDLIYISNLREAPAIGAGIDAYLTKFDKKC